ncbi:MAG: type II secretion system protein, partial [bacterium]|nr:type II secretion system protein [bacterium]
MRHQKGFTLIELLIVIAIIGILAAVVIIAVNPGRQIALGNNAARQSAVNSILNSLGQFGADNAGLYPDPITAVAAGTNSVIGTCAAGATCTSAAVAAVCVNLTGADLLASRTGN